MSEAVSARDHVVNWVRDNQDRIGSVPIKIQRNETPAKFLSIWFSTPKYLIDISTWDHAFCLDIVVVNLNTKKTDYCGVLPRLERFETQVFE